MSDAIVTAPLLPSLCGRTMSGVEALAILPQVQAELDRLAGRKTRGYVSGYRGSPLGNLDMAFERVRGQLDASGIVFEPAINEEAAATAVWGTQQVHLVGDSDVEGVFAMWYGKGPGVDRATDALKHGNHAGTHPAGGVLVVAGDDHPGKSSTVAHQSEPALAACHIPCLYPANVSEIIEYGLLGWELSRRSGLWVALKCVNETVEQSGVIDFDVTRFLPGGRPPPDRAPFGGGYRSPMDMEKSVRRDRLPAVTQFARQAGLDITTVGDATAAHNRLTIVTSGKAHGDVLRALDRLGLTDQRCRQLGVAVFKAGLVWPLDPAALQAVSAFAAELLFVEEKGAFLEVQACQSLINAERRPRVVGKVDDDGEPLLPSDEQVESLRIAEVIHDRLGRLGLVDPQLDEAASALRTLRTTLAQRAPATPRMPYFCSGCPHGSSTRVPPGSQAMAGIGCHAMAVYLRTDTLLPTQMGGEGMNWNGLRHFTSTRHMFQNLGDGTYFHSGLLAIRSAVSAGANITYKILYNDAVAMTGGQAFEGPLSVARIAEQVLAEGVARCVIVSADPADLADRHPVLPAGVDVFPRAELMAVQAALRDTPRCTVLIYDQPCAAELRRKRTRGLIAKPAKRVFINPNVCEGCGDCSAQSTCISIRPKPTAEGVKREIDQSACNLDFACVGGFCPSFITVKGGVFKGGAAPVAAAPSDADLPEPRPRFAAADGLSIILAGIGGTGVISVARLLAEAAKADGLATSSFDMTGLSQKNGAVFSHLRIGGAPRFHAMPKIGPGEADLVLGLDLLAAAAGDASISVQRARSWLVANSDLEPDARFQVDHSQLPAPAAQMERLVDDFGAARTLFVDARTRAIAACGDAMASNLVVVGAALQAGLLPILPGTLDRLIAQGGPQSEKNRLALIAGRAAVASVAADRNWPAGDAAGFAARSLDDLVRSEARALETYQDRAYADRYLRAMARLRARISAIGADPDPLLPLIARNYAAIMRYKDEYVVARMLSDKTFLQSIRAQYDGSIKLYYHLAPPFLTAFLKSQQPRKMEISGAIRPLLAILKKGKFLRGSRLDPFGYSHDRKLERELLAKYEAFLDAISTDLAVDDMDWAVAMAACPETVRGYGHVKQARFDDAMQRWKELSRARPSLRAAQLSSVAQ